MHALRHPLPHRRPAVRPLAPAALAARIVRAALALALALAAGAAAADRSDPEVVTIARLGGDVFAGGGTVTIYEPVAGDLVVGGGSVDVDAPVAGDAVAMGGRVRLGVDVGQDLYAAGGQLSVTGKVGHNARVAGGQVELGPRSEVVGNLSVAGGNVRLLGKVGGQVQIAGGRLLIDGTVAGDVIAAGGQLALGPNARIGGKLRYHTGDTLEQDPAAQVAGGIERLEIDFGRGRAASEPRAPRAERHFSGPLGVWTAGIALLAALLVVALPGFSARVGRTLRERTGWSLLFGFVLLVCTPVAVLLLLLSLIGIPIGLATIALYLALLPLAYAAAAIGIGDMALQRWRAASAGQRGWRIGAAVVVVVALALLGWVPVVGGLVAFAVLLAGLGALVLQLTPMRPAAAA